MTDAELAAIKAREEQATYGPWDVDAATWGIVQHSHPLPIVYGNAHYGIWCDADATFIAHAREDIPALLMEVDVWREIGRALAKLEYSLPTDNAGEAYCPWCAWAVIGPLDEHEATCPLTRARALLDHGATSTD